MLTDTEAKHIEECVGALVEGLGALTAPPIRLAMQRWVEGEKDYLLRMARISKMRTFLDELARQAEQYKVIDLPLWYVGGDDGRYGDRGCPTWILLREDADPEAFEHVCSNAYDAQYAPAHPIYRAFYENGYMLGNRATPPKKYFKATYLYNNRSSGYWRDYLSRHLGPICWHSLPKEDVNGRYICR